IKIGEKIKQNNNALNSSIKEEITTNLVKIVNKIIASLHDYKPEAELPMPAKYLEINNV
ncbi:F0F1 ATP synthase subunit alpha, partial [Xanthomonas citri pv. citri]|nr:F0F1 ATP synthase subunit alpha [Xanthomonas citri pv. citri]